MTLTTTQMVLLGLGAVALFVGALYMGQHSVRMWRETHRAARAAYSPRKARVLMIVGAGWGTVVGLFLVYFMFKYLLAWLSGRG